MCPASLLNWWYIVDGQWILNELVNIEWFFLYYISYLLSHKHFGTSTKPLWRATVNMHLLLKSPEFSWSGLISRRLPHVAAMSHAGSSADLSSAPSVFESDPAVRWLRMASAQTTERLGSTPQVSADRVELFLWKCKCEDKHSCRSTFQVSLGRAG